VRGQKAAAGADGVLVVGSYPPVGTPGAAATVAAVRRAIAGGDDPVVVSPRPSAAHYSVPVSGVFAGRRLDHMRRVTGAKRLILCAERDLPLPTGFAIRALLRLVHRTTLREVRRAGRRFDHVTVIFGDDLGVAAHLVNELRAMADEVVELEEHPPGDPGVTVLGPRERTPVEELTNLGRRVARRALGPLYPKIRRIGASAVQRTKAAATPGASRLRASLQGRQGPGPRH
jgi:hypothetical protein